MVMELYRIFYKAEGVIEFLGLGAICFIGTMDQMTSLKYPKTSGDQIALTTLGLEAQIPANIGTSQVNH